MTKKRICSATLALLLAVAPALTAAQDATSADVQGARLAATSWLQQLDAGRYADTWVNAANLFKTAVPQSQWETAVQATREPLGALKSRAEASAKASTSLPGVPDGQYVVLTYDTSFEHKQRATETVATVLQPGGVWKVAGWFVR